MTVIKCSVTVLARYEWRKHALSHKYCLTFFEERLLYNYTAPRQNHLHSVWLHTDRWLEECRMLEGKSKVSIISMNLPQLPTVAYRLCHEQQATKDSLKALLNFTKLQRTTPEHTRHSMQRKKKYQTFCIWKKIGSDLWNKLE